MLLWCELPFVIRVPVDFDASIVNSERPWNGEKHNCGTSKGTDSDRELQETIGE